MNGPKSCCEGAGPFEITNGEQDGIARITSGDWQEDVDGVAELIVIPLSVNGLLLMAFIALPLDAVTNIIAGIEDIMSIVDWLVYFLVDVAGIGRYKKLDPGSLSSRNDGVVAS